MRPTKYKKEYADKVIELMKEGASIEEICLEIGIAKQTFYNWTAVYPELLDAKKIGEDFSKGWWLREGRRNLKDKDFSFTGWYMNMKNRFGWKDKHDVTTNDKEIVQSIDYTKLSNAALEEIAGLKSE